MQPVLELTAAQRARDTRDAEGDGIYDRPELALQWAERGLASFREGPDPRLRAFVADRYRHADRW